ncbi:hypothetical protein [Providencia sp. PROV196]|uniref:hypothetical protein n=1 Tax=Providencia sp. PROV196 TaxID=2949897 RepID=UPI00234B36ED|nr:hypothetical protein [Providencia sp. PROV196]
MALTDRSRINYEINLRILSSELEKDAEIMQESILNAREELEKNKEKLSNDLDISIVAGRGSEKDRADSFKYVDSLNDYLNIRASEYKGNIKLSELMNEYIENPDKRTTILEQIRPLAKKASQLRNEPILSRNDYPSMDSAIWYDLKSNIYRPRIDNDFKYQVGNVFNLMNAEIDNDNGYISNNVYNYMEDVKYIREGIPRIEKSILEYEADYVSDKESFPSTEYYNEFISSLKDKVKEDKRIVSIINETIKEYAIKNPNSTIHLSGNSGFSPVDILGEWTVSFIDNHFISIGSPNEVNIINLTPPVMPMIPNAN